VRSRRVVRAVARERDRASRSTSVDDDAADTCAHAVAAQRIASREANA
jgi:hypothetical protein